MRNLLAFLAAAVLAFAGVGWYLGWYTVQRTSVTDGKHEIRIDIDGRKVSQDLQKGTEKIHKALEQSSKEGTPSTTTSAKTPGL